jgi:RimJ/RimL family protein N-acetyltransferase
MHSLVLRDGRTARLRALRQDDAPRIQAFVRALSPAARHARFFNALSELSAERLNQMLFAPGLSLAAFGADGHIVAHAQYVLQDGSAEFALAVGEYWRRKTLGAQLVTLLTRHARQAGALVLGGLTLADNDAMRQLAGKLGFVLKRSGDPTLARFEAS